MELMRSIKVIKLLLLQLEDNCILCNMIIVLGMLYLMDFVEEASIEDFYLFIINVIIIVIVIIIG